jgi:hypothetical protein
MENEVKINLIFKGEPLYLIEMIRAQTGMSHTELFSKMLELYKLVYLSKYELALIQGDVIVQKFNTEDLKRKTTNL